MRYRLVSKHYINDRILDEGTIVGDDTSFPIPENGVTPEMEGLDDASKEEVKRVRDEQSKPFMTAAPLGMVQLEPAVQNALIELARGQRGQASDQPTPSPRPPQQPGQPPRPGQPPTPKPKEDEDDNDKKSLAGTFSAKVQPEKK